jgi:hypothetical protein
MQEIFDTGLSKIKQEIKSLLVHHGLFGSVTNVETAATEHAAACTTIDVIVKGRTAARSFDNAQIEACCLRVKGPVLVGITSMVDELSA